MVGGVETMSNVLLVDLLNEELETILCTNVKYIHPDDYLLNEELTTSIMQIIRHQKTDDEFYTWYDEVYIPMRYAYQKKYELLTSEGD